MPRPERPEDLMREYVRQIFNQWCKGPKALGELMPLCARAALAVYLPRGSGIKLRASIAHKAVREVVSSASPLDAYGAELSLLKAVGNVVEELRRKYGDVVPEALILWELLNQITELLKEA
jgi:hypothetical protein